MASVGALEATGIGLVVFLAALLRGYAGFGSSLLMVPVLALVIGPRTAVAIGVLLEGVATLMLVPATYRFANRHAVRKMGTAAVLAVPLGHLALISLDPSMTNLAISAAVTLMTAMMWRGKALWLPRGTATQISVGATSGFLTGFGSVGGPPLVLYILAGPDAAAQKRADVIAVAGIAQGAAIISMTVFGVLTLGGAVGALLLAPVFFGGGILGAQLFSRSSDRAYQRIALGALFASAVSLMIVNAFRLLA
jgi:uncharacterized membrane protein YfcA